jgi:hypothetical protein
MGGEGSGKPKAELLKLDGTQLDHIGNATKTDFFKFLELPAEHNADLAKVMTPAQALKFRNHVVRMKIGTSAMIPMLCGGPKCPVKQCPFHDNKNWPLAKPCPVEATLVAAWTQSYVEDIGVQPEERTEMILINKLVECDMIDYRANIGLSKDEDGWSLIKTDIIDNGQSQQEVSTLHPLLEAKSKAHSERMRVLESFSVTRKEKAKKAAMLKQREEGDIGQHWADIKTALTAAKKIQQGGSLEEIKKDAKDVASSDFVQADWETQE